MPYERFVVCGLKEYFSVLSLLSVHRLNSLFDVSKKLDDGQYSVLFYFAQKRYWRLAKQNEHFALLASHCVVVHVHLLEFLLQSALFQDLYFVQRVVKEELFVEHLDVTNETAMISQNEDCYHFPNDEPHSDAKNPFAKYEKLLYLDLVSRP